MEQENTHNELKKEMNHLHRRICGLLTSEKEVVARKKGEDIEKELNQVRGITKKYTAEIDKLKREW